MSKIMRSIITLLFFTIIGSAAYVQAQPSSNSETPKASFTMDSYVYDFGNIPENGGSVSHTFTITNTGSEPLVIKQVLASCGCTTSTMTTNPIAPGQEGQIHVAYSPKGRPNAFEKPVTVYPENAEPVQLTIKGNVINDDIPRAPIFTIDNPDHDFGTIGENDGYADHIFKVTNTGNAPLIISRVTATCGCTRPDHTQTPIEPGQEGIIAIAFNPRGYHGTFSKNATVYTNEGQGMKTHRLTISGFVVDKPKENLTVKYIDTIGNVGIEKKLLEHTALNLLNANNNLIYIKNYNEETVYFGLENIPEYMTVNYPDSLLSRWQGQITVSVDETVFNKPGRTTSNLILTVKDRNGNVIGNENVSMAVNRIEDFSELSPLQKVNSPLIDIDNAQLDFGEVKKGKISKQFVITNTGKADLIVHSLSSDDPRVELSAIKEGTSIKTGKSLTVKATINAKDLNKDINTDICVISNAPRKPISKIAVTAKNTN